MILAVSFGTASDGQCSVTIGAIEQELAQAFPGHEVRRAFASQTIIDALKERDAAATDNVAQALDRAAADGVRDLIVQPVYVVDGYGYQVLEGILEQYGDRFRQIVLGAPLLSDDPDLDTLVSAVAQRVAPYADGRTAVCLMGHGTKAQSGQDGVYQRLQDRFRAAGYGDCFVGTMHAASGAADLAAALRDRAVYDRAVLMPLMLTAGKHVRRHMAGDAADSWKTVLSSEGYDVICVMEGLGQLPAVRTLFVEHARAAAARLR